MNALKKIRNIKGFTLVELIIYMGIMMVLIMILTDILVAVLATQLSSQSTSQVSQDGRYIYTRLIYDVNRAQSVLLPLNLGETSNSLQATINGTVYTYSLSGGNLVVTDPNGTDQLNSIDSSVSGLQFKRIGNQNGKNTFQINFTVISKIQTKGVTDQEIFQTTAGLR